MIIFVCFRLKTVPWVTSLLEPLQNNLTRTVIRFAQIAMNLSNNKKDIESWVEIFQKHFTENCEELISDMNNLQTDVLDKIEKSLAKIQELCKYLQIEMPNLENEKLSLYQEHHKLKQYISE